MNLKQAQDMLKGAGYKNMGGGHGVYIHPETGHELHLFNYQGGKQNWQKWLEAGELPQPPKVVANIKGKWWQIKVIKGENGRYLEFSHVTRVLYPDEAREMANAIIEAIDTE